MPRQMTLGSLCTGYGGLDLAVNNVFESQTSWVCDNDRNVCRLLADLGLLNLGDLTQINWADVQPIDVLTAGYPCQPFSHAGSRKGTDDHRHLWPWIAEAIGFLRPRYVVLENVAGHLTLGFANVLADLTRLGYDARWGLVRASDVGAPHRRERLFILADSGHDQRASSVGGVRAESADGSGRRPTATDAGGGSFSGASAVADRVFVAAERRAELASNSDGDARTEPQRTDRRVLGTPGKVIDGSDRGFSWSGTPYEPAIRRWEQATRPAPEPLAGGRLRPEFVEWMMGLPEGHVTGHQIAYTEQLKILGNGVVPQQAEFALRTLLAGGDRR